MQSVKENSHSTLPLSMLLLLPPLLGRSLLSLTDVGSCIALCASCCIWIRRRESDRLATLMHGVSRMWWTEAVSLSLSLSLSLSSAFPNLGNPCSIVYIYGVGEVQTMDLVLHFLLMITLERQREREQWTFGRSPSRSTYSYIHFWPVCI